MPRPRRQSVALPDHITDAHRDNLHAYVTTIAARLRVAERDRRTADVMAGYWSRRDAGVAAWFAGDGKTLGAEIEQLTETARRIKDLLGE